MTSFSVHVGRWPGNEALLLFPSLLYCIPLSPPFLTFTLPFYCLLCSHFISCPSLSLQSFLKGLYISWLTSKPVRLEPLLAELLTDMRLPSINCLPIKKPFGALKEVVLHPIHEDTTLPYTSTAAIQLLRSVGRNFYTASLVCS